MKDTVLALLAVSLVFAVSAGCVGQGLEIMGKSPYPEDFDYFSYGDNVRAMFITNMDVPCVCAVVPGEPTYPYYTFELEQWIEISDVVESSEETEGEFHYSCENLLVWNYKENPKVIWPQKYRAFVLCATGDSEEEIDVFKEMADELASMETAIEVFETLGLWDGHEFALRKSIYGPDREKDYYLHLFMPSSGRWSLPEVEAISWPFYINPFVVIDVEEQPTPDGLKAKLSHGGEPMFCEVASITQGDFEGRLSHTAWRDLFEEDHLSFTPLADVEQEEYYFKEYESHTLNQFYYRCHYETPKGVVWFFGYDEFIPTPEEQEAEEETPISEFASPNEPHVIEDIKGIPDTASISTGDCEDRLCEADQFARDLLATADYLFGKHVSGKFKGYLDWRTDYEECPPEMKSIDSLYLNGFWEDGNVYQTSPTTEKVYYVSADTDPVPIDSLEYLESVYLALKLPDGVTTTYYPTRMDYGLGVAFFDDTELRHDVYPSSSSAETETAISSVDMLLGLHDSTEMSMWEAIAEKFPGVLDIDEDGEYNAMPKAADGSGYYDIPLDCDSDGAMGETTSCEGFLWTETQETDSYFYLDGYNLIEPEGFFLVDYDVDVPSYTLVYGEPDEVGCGRVNMDLEIREAKPMEIEVTEVTKQPLSWCYVNPVKVKLEDGKPFMLDSDYRVDFELTDDGKAIKELRIVKGSDEALPLMKRGELTATLNLKGGQYEASEHYETDDEPVDTGRPAYWIEFYPPVPDHAYIEKPLTMGFFGVPYYVTRWDVDGGEIDLVRGEVASFVERGVSKLVESGLSRHRITLEDVDEDRGMAAFTVNCNVECSPHEESVTLEIAGSRDAFVCGGRLYMHLNSIVIAFEEGEPPVASLIFSGAPLEPYTLK